MLEQDDMTLKDFIVTVRFAYFQLCRKTTYLYTISLYAILIGLHLARIQLRSNKIQINISGEPHEKHIKNIC